MTKPPWTVPIATGPVRSLVHLPGSTSMTARALILGALSVGPSTLAGPRLARDTELVGTGLRTMGVTVSTMDDKRWVVRPRPLTGPARVDLGRADAVTRFLPPLATLATGPVIFDGDPGARQHSLEPLVRALRALGCRIDTGSGDGLPLTVHGSGRVGGGPVRIDGPLPGGLVSGLLLAAPDFDRGLALHVSDPPAPQAPSVRMTVGMLRAAGAAVDDSEPGLWRVEPGRLTGRAWEIEPDLTCAAPFLAAALVTGGSVTIPGWPRTTAQVGDRFREVLTEMGGACVLTEAGLTVTGQGTITGVDVDLRGAIELAPAIAALATLAVSPSTIRGIGRPSPWRRDRIAALVRGLTALGADISEESDAVTIRPRPLTGTVFETYDDHRMTDAAVIIGLAVPGVVLPDTAFASGSFPDFPARWSGLIGTSQD